MSELLTMRGFERYQPEEPPYGETTPYFRDDQGRDWYEWRYRFRDDTLKLIVDESDGTIVGYADSAELMAPFDFTITEVMKEDVPAGLTLDFEHTWRFAEGKIYQTASGREKDMKSLRDVMLGATDFMVVADYPMSAKDSKVLKTARQTLRDITQLNGFPQVPFPEMPDVVLNAMKQKGLSLGSYTYLRGSL